MGFATVTAGGGGADACFGASLQPARAKKAAAIERAATGRAAETMTMRSPWERDRVLRLALDSGMSDAGLPKKIMLDSILARRPRSIQ
jgi:hypothetical protein